MSHFDCTDIKASLSALIDDAMDAATRHRAERHIAECPACRTMVDEVERADAALTESAASQVSDRLPDGFVPAVLARTVYADRLKASGGGIVSWLGWIAAAACLALSGVIWVVNNAPPAGRQVVVPVADSVYTPGPSARSWTDEGALSPQVLEYLRAPASQDAAGATAPPMRNVRPVLSIDDADTVDSAAYLLQLLSEANVSSFADLETVRQAADYDEIVPRLAALRARLGPEDLTAVMAAESVLFRLVSGPLSLEDVIALKTSVSDLQIVYRLDQIDGRRPASAAL